jgi:hypothetical protein
MTKLKCPYCSDPNIFQKAFAAPIGKKEVAALRAVRNNIWRSASDIYGLINLKKKEVTRGDFKIITITGDDLAEAWSSLTIEILGVKFLQEPPYPPPDQFFKRGGESSYDVASEDTTGLHTWYLYNIYRITHRDINLVIDVHWWPDHGRVVTIQDFDPAGTSIADIQMINDALKLFRIETRGGVKITEERIRQFFAKSGAATSQKDAARTLNVTENGLEKWRARRGMSNWQEVVERFSP